MSGSGHRLCVCAKYSYNQHKTSDKDLLAPSPTTDSGGLPTPGQGLFNTADACYRHGHGSPTAASMSLCVYL